jgi:hypothetical protein
MGALPMYLVKVVRITTEFMGLDEAIRTSAPPADDRRESSVLNEANKLQGHVTQGIEIER